jgi:TRAP transporter TAXI family solute receptor
MTKRNPALHRIQSAGKMTPARRWTLIAVALIVLAALIWAAWSLAEPAVRNRIVITTGADGGIYRGFAEQYAPLLKRKGITLDIRPSSGSVENYERLADPNSDYDIGFIQSGTVHPKDTDNLQTIAAVSYEPIWVFYRGAETVDRLMQLRGKRISVGVPGSGLLNVSLTLLGLADVTRENSTLIQLDADDAYQGLENGTLDAAFFIGRPDAPMQQKLLNSDLKLMSFALADAFVQKFPSLSKITYPRGATSIAKDRPSEDVTLLAATAQLVAKDSLHPALAFVLLEVAKTVHGGEDYFTTVGAFPNLNTAEFPVSDESARYFKSGPPFLQRYLPFWLASFIERRLLILVPFLAVLVGLLQALPRMLEARVKQRLVVWYRELKSLEDEIWKTAQPTPELIEQWREEIEEIDAYAGQIRMPQRYFQDVYALKQAIAVVRNRIVQIAAHTSHANIPD